MNPAAPPSNLAEKSVAIVGSGPAGLMAASVLSRSSAKVTLFEKRKSAGRKLLVAGSSGLNISNSLPLAEFLDHYEGRLPWEAIFENFGVRDWLRFIEDLGIGTFEGTSGRYFVEEMKAARLLQAWMKALKDARVEFVSDAELSGIESNSGERKILRFRSVDERGSSYEFDAVVLALGGGSYENEPPSWPSLLNEQGLKVEPFRSSNCGFQIAWPEKFLQEAEGQPLKSLELSSSRGRRRGEMVITRYGLEGTPVYAVGVEGTNFVDLKPDLTEEKILQKLHSVKENLSPLRRAKKILSLSPPALALLFHLAPEEAKKDLSAFARVVKKLPLEFLARQPLNEAISSSGGLALSEVDDHLALKKLPGFYAAGEMLAWDAPTGGFLLQASVGQGAFAARSVAEDLGLSV